MRSTVSCALGVFTSLLYSSAQEVEYGVDVVRLIPHGLSVEEHFLGLTFCFSVLSDSPFLCQHQLCLVTPQC
jgi:hypothetical protein